MKQYRTIEQMCSDAHSITLNKNGLELSCSSYDMRGNGLPM